MANPNPPLKNLKSFKPGESGNPDGKPKGTLNFKTRAKWLLEATEEITHPVTGKKVTISIADQIDVALIRAARKGESWAVKEVLDRLEGKSAQAVDITSDGEKISNMIYMPAKKSEDYDADKLDS